MIGELLSEVGGRVGHGLVLAWFESYVLRLVFLDSSLQSPGLEKDFGILFIPLRGIVREIVVCRDIVEEIMANLAWFSVLLVLLCSSPGILRQPQHLARKRETFGYLFCTCTPYGSRVSLIGEEEEEGKKMTIFDFIKIRFLGFYKAERKSEDIFVLRRVRAFQRYPFC